MEQYINNIAEKLMGYKGLHFPVIDSHGNTSKQNLVLHTNRWLNQFDETDRYDLARLTSNLLDNFYVEEADEISYIESLFNDSLINQNGLVATPLVIQGNGKSQKDLVESYEKYVAENGYAYNPNVFIYLDDFLFSGGRVYSDLSNYLSMIQEDKNIIIALMGAFSYSLWNSKKKIKSKIENLYSEKKIEVTVKWKVDFEFENRLSKLNSSDVLWPMQGTLNSPELNIYKLEKFNYRSGFIQSLMFSNNNDRIFLERVCLKYGYRIIERCTNVHSTTRPLGNSFYNYGFGGLIFNYRNCPNNTPLIFWWGSTNPFDPMNAHWYPLMQRRTYQNG